MKKLTENFKFNNSGKINLNNIDSKWIRTREQSGTKSKFWLGTTDEPKSFFVKLTDNNTMRDVAEVISTKMLKSLGLPFVETALAEIVTDKYNPTLSEKTTTKERLIDKILHKNKANQGNLTYCNCIIAENFTIGKNIISASDIIDEVNSSLSNQKKLSGSSLFDFKKAIEIQGKYTFSKETELAIQKLLVLDFCTGQTDRTDFDIFFEVNDDNSLSLQPIVDNEMMNYFNYNHSIFQDVINNSEKTNNSTNFFEPHFAFFNIITKGTFVSSMLNYPDLDFDEILKFTKSIQEMNIVNLFQDLSDETGYKITPVIPNFFEKFKNERCEILITELEKSKNKSISNDKSSNSDTQEPSNSTLDNIDIDFENDTPSNI